MRKISKPNKQDQINHLYVTAVNAVKLKGVHNSQLEIYKLIDSIVSKKDSIEPLHTSHDIQSQTYLKIFDWLVTGKRGKALSVEAILNPYHIKKTASSFGFSGAKYPSPVCRLEDWSPIEEYLATESDPESISSELYDIWITYDYKLDSIAKKLIEIQV
jgi:hypothetical protein